MCGERRRVETYVRRIFVLILSAQDDDNGRSLTWVCQRDKPGKTVHDTPNNAMPGLGKRGIMYLNVEWAEVCSWLRLANPKVQRKPSSPRRLNRNRDAHGIVRVHLQPPRTAPDSPPRCSSTPSAKARKLCSFRKSKPYSPKGTPQTQFSTCGQVR